MAEDWPDEMEDVEPIIDADTAFLSALETLDVKRIMDQCSDSDSVTMVFPGVDLARGPLAVRLAWSRVSEQTTRLKTVLKPVTAIRMGDLGYVFLDGTILSTHGDETLSVEVYVTNIYIRESGGWKVLHHHATPAPHQPSYLEQRLN